MFSSSFRWRDLPDVLDTSHLALNTDALSNGQTLLAAAPLLFPRSHTPLFLGKGHLDVVKGHSSFSGSAVSLELAKIGPSPR